MPSPTNERILEVLRGPMMTAFWQAGIVSTVSNILGQMIDCWQRQVCSLPSLTPSTPKTPSSHKLLPPMPPSIPIILTPKPHPQVPFTFSPLQLLNFLILHCIVFFPNYKWQEFLEYTFPSYPSSNRKSNSNSNRNRGRYTSIPLEEQGVEKDRDSNVGGDVDADDDDAAADATGTGTAGGAGGSTSEGRRTEPRPKSWRQKLGKVSVKNTALKWFIDCITVGAIMNTAAFLIIIGVLKGQTLVDIGHNLKTRELQIILDGYKLWPWAGLFNFLFIPVEKRLVFFSFVGLCWNIYLSIVAARL